MTELQTHSTHTDIRRYHFVVPSILQAFAWAPTRMLFNFFCHFKVEGKKHRNASVSKPILYVANHRSEWDPIAVRAALPWLWRHGPLFYVTAPLRSFLDGPVMTWRHKLYSSSWFFSFWGAHPVTEKTGNYERALHTHIQLLEKHGVHMLIFPEGKIVRDGDKRKVHGGAGFLALLEHVTIVPVGIAGFRNMTLGSFLKRKHYTRVVFGEPKTAADFTHLTEESEHPHRDIAEHIMQEITVLLGEDE